MSTMDDMSGIRDAAREFADAYRRFDRVTKPSSGGGFRVKMLESRLVARVLELQRAITEHDGPRWQVDMIVAQGMKHVPGALEFLRETTRKDT